MTKTTNYFVPKGLDDTERSQQDLLKNQENRIKILEKKSVQAEATLNRLNRQVHNHMNTLSMRSSCQSEQEKHTEKLIRPNAAKPRKPDEENPYQFSKPAESKSMPQQNYRMKELSKLDVEKACQFCDEINVKFDGAGLDVHYWKHCPMLKRCNRCKMVIEISRYSEHLLTECERKAEYVRCDICKEAVLKSDLENHKSNQSICIYQPPKPEPGENKKVRISL